MENWSPSIRKGGLPFSFCKTICRGSLFFFLQEAQLLGKPLAAGRRLVAGRGHPPKRAHRIVRDGTHGGRVYCKSRADASPIITHRLRLVLIPAFGDPRAVDGGSHTATTLGAVVSRTAAYACWLAALTITRGIY
jgi:hypothetical protein